MTNMNTIHELIWGYAGLVFTLLGVILGSIGLINYLVRQGKINHYKKQYLKVIKNLDTKSETYIQQFSKETLNYLNNIINLSTTNILRNPFDCDVDSIHWVIYNMIINLNTTPEQLSELQQHLSRRD